MCPSTPAANVGIVSLELSRRTGSHSCLVTLHIQDECGCVRRISKKFYLTNSVVGNHWMMRQVIPQTACAQHAEAVATAMAARLQHSSGLILEEPTLSS